MGGRELEAVMLSAMGPNKPDTEIRPASGVRIRLKTGHHRGTIPGCARVALADTIPSFRPQQQPGPKGHAMTCSMTIPAVARKAVGAAWCGCDVSKDSFEAALWLPLEPGERRENRELPAASFQRNPEGVEAFLAWADRLLEPSAGPDGELPALRLVLEATGRYSMELAVWVSIARVTVQVAIINPETARTFIRSLCLRDKTDRIDARGLGRYGAERQPFPWQPLTPQQAELRDLARYRQDVVTMRVAENLRLNEKGISTFLRRMITTHVAKLERDQAKIEARMRAIVEQVPELKRDVELLDTIPGVGFLTAATVLAELGDLRRFGRARQLSAFAGLSPRHHDSGQSVHRKPRLCKKGSSLARKTLYMPALAAIRSDNDFTDTYKSLCANGKPKMSAIGAVMRRMLLVMRAMLISGKPYQPHHRRTWARPVDNSSLSDKKIT